MNKKILVLLVAMVVTDIIDNDFTAFSILDIVKAVLYVVCFTLLIIDARKEGKK